MATFNFSYDLNVSLEQRLAFEMAALVWSSFLQDDATINLQIAATDGLNGNEAVGGAVPIFHEVNYGVFLEYLQQDATSSKDESVITVLQDGNTVDILFDADGNPLTDSELIDGNSTIMLTSAQAKALGMEGELVLGDGSVWDRDVLDNPGGLDGYIVVNNSYEWSYDLTRAGVQEEGTLDFLTMALHEIGHSLGFVSGLDGLLESFTLHSGETRLEGFTYLDLLRYSEKSTQIENPDGTVSDLTLGGAAYFSLDGGATVAAEFEEGDQYQASHWQRYQNAIGIMDPTLGYTERTDISHLDLQAFDVLGWDVDYSAFENGLDFDALHRQAIAAISENFSVGVDAVAGAIENGQDWYSLGYGSWWQAFKDQMLELGYGSWWQEFETDLLNLGYGSWWQAFEEDMLNLGYGSWWQSFEDKVLELGYGSWWSTFEADMGQDALKLGYGSWWQSFEPQMLELSYGSWWQIFEQQMLSLGYGSWWQQFEADLLDLGYGSWWQAFESQILELGYGSWWQVFEEQVLELGYGSWWQQFEGSMLELGYGSWWQMFELGYGSWWQQIETHLDELNPEAFSANNTTAPIGDQSLTGGVNDDILAGNTGNDLISGGAGDDLIDGKAEDDLLLGGMGDDIVYGWTGNDILFGGEDDDFLSGEDGNDKLHGEAGHDILVGGRGMDTLVGGVGRDVLKGDTDDDVLDGGADDDRLTGGSGNDLLVGGSGADVLDGGTGNDRLFGDEYVDTQKVSAAGVEEQTSAVYDIDATPDLWIRMEAEDMQLSNYNLDERVDASGGEVVVTKGRGEVKSDFSGPSGTYDLILGFYHDSAKAEVITVQIHRGATFEVLVEPSSGGLVTYRLSDVGLDSGDRLKIKGSSPAISLDYMDIVTPGFVPAFDDNGNPLGNYYEVVDSYRDDYASQRIEAEDLQLDGFSIVDEARTSGDRVITNQSSSATATYTHTGDSGKYNLYLNYLDGSASTGTMAVLLNGKTLSQWEIQKGQGNSHERLLALNMVLNQGDVIEIQNQNISGEIAIDYLRLDLASQVDNSEFGSTSHNRIEIEQMMLTGDFKVEDGKDFASNETIVKSEDDITGFNASTTFAGQTGYYDIVIGYYDEDDGEAQYSASLMGQELASWTSTLNLQDGSASAQSFITKTIRNVLINEDDSFNLQSIAEDGDDGYLDYVEFLPHNPEAIIRVEAEKMRLLSGDADLKEYDFASSGYTIKSKSEDVAKTVNLETAFDGLDGIYDVVIGYYDENDGLAQFTASLNGSHQASWVADQNLGHDDVSVQTFTTKTISGVQLNTGDIFKLTSLREDADYGQVDYIEFVPFSQVTDENILQIEVEDMDLAGKVSLKTEEFAHGGAFVETDKTGFTGTTLFSGETGYYQVVVGYYDDNSGAAELALKVDNKEVDRWFSDQDLGANKAEFSTFTTYELSQVVQISNLDLIEISGVEGNGDKANLDYIQFIQVDAPPIYAVDPIKLSDNADSLNGGAGNDDIFGGSGDDHLFGNSGNDYLDGGTGKDILTGTDAIALGSGEYDILIGGGGADKFILGDNNNAYYATGGATDYALIYDLTLGEDQVFLFGSAADYTLTQTNSMSSLYRHGTELVAQFNNIGSTNTLDNPTFVFSDDALEMAGGGVTNALDSFKLF